VKGAIDCWVNVNMGEQARIPFIQRVKEDYFHAGDEFVKSYTLEETLDAMDAAGVERAVVSIDGRRPDPKILAFPERHPERFALAASHDVRSGMQGLRKLEELIRARPVALVRLVPFLVDLPPDHRLYYPVYARCIELGVAVSVNTGIPGPPMPGECQNPMHLDRVCLDFPELRLVMAHGADPWWGEAIRLMIKYGNLHLMTSAYAPRYLPPELIHFMNTRGQDKILFASDHPVLSMERCTREARALDLREGVLEKYLHANAQRLLFA